MSITVIDVAKEAGVSRTTVSNVFNNRAKYSDETRDAVLAAAKKLGYKPNLAAQSLITNKSRLIGLILPSYVDTNTLTNSPFYNIIIDSVYSVLRNEAYYDLIIFSVPHKEKLIQVSEWIDARGVDGILAIGEYDQGFLKDINSKAIPVVLLDNYSRANYSNFSYVNSDDETGGYLATQKLIAGGYKKIGVCSVSLYSPLMQKRYEGYKRALDEVGYKEHVFDATGTPFEAGMQLGDVLLAQEIDAVFCTEDMLAVGVLHCLLKKEICVGKNFGLVGFDNINVGRQVHPELTTVDQSISEKGETATKTLLNILNRKSSLGSRLVLPVRLISRETAG
ncbi:MAG TPA: LacI family DNA-binding transcriptional regulator [Anaerolineales bacterium]|nr:LacI family DNA-binding transcriptional regulator [Anaerolineales bacterium]